MCLFTATNLPMVSGCPSDIVMFSEDRLTSVMWSEPTFSNLGATGQVPQLATPPGIVSYFTLYTVCFVLALCFYLTEKKS